MPIPLETMLDKASPDARREIDARSQAMIADNRSRNGGGAIDGRPPRLAEAAIAWSVREVDRAGILDDLNRRFAENIARHDRRRANRLYWIDAISALGPLMLIRLGQRLAPSWLASGRDSPPRRRP